MGKVIAFPVKEPGVHTYCPEMGQQVISCQIKLDMVYDFNYFISTPIHLSGRGIVVTGHYEEDGQKVIKYRLTNCAFKKLSQQYSIGYEELLD